MIRSLLVLLLITFAPLGVMAQIKTHTLRGAVHVKNEGDCEYKVVFAVSGNTVMGYSVTSLSFGTNVTTAIKGTIDKQAHTINFAEEKLAEPPLEHACYFNVKLTWALVGDHYVFTGAFIGKDDKGKYCDEGTVTMELQKESDTLFETRKPEHKDIAVKKRISRPAVVTPPDTPKVVQPDAPKEVIKITASAQKEFEWHTDSCILEIWDGEYVDGDLVTVLFNGEKVLESYSLLASRRRLRLHLRPKVNRLLIIAENEGKAPPNTSQILLTDGAVSYSVLSCLNTGDTATILIKRKKK